MKSRWIVNLLLLLVVVVLAFVARFEPGIDTPQQQTAITPLRQAAIHRIHINRPVRDDLVMERRSDGQWQLLRAIPLPADEFNVRALTRLVEQQPVRRYPAADMNLAELQLAPPVASVFFNDTAVEFGTLEPIDGLRYVRVGKWVYLIHDNYLQLMEVAYSQFVRRRLFATGDRIAALHLPGINLTRAPQGWQLEPKRAVGTDKLLALIDSWQEATAISVQAAEPGKPSETVKVRLNGNDTPVIFEIVSRKPSLIVARPDFGIQYQLGDRSAAMLELEAGAGSPE